MQTFLSDSTSRVALLNCGANRDALKIAEGLLTKGYDLLMVCHPDLQEEATEFQKATERTGKNCTVVVRKITTLEFYRQLMSTIYLKFGWLNIYIDYATPHPQKPTDDQAQLSATLLWMYLQLLPPPLNHISYNLLQRHISV